MSASLPVRAKALRERLIALNQLADNVKENGLLEDLRSDLEAPTDSLGRAMGQRSLLIDSGIAVEEPETLDVARKRAIALIEKFSAEKKAAVLKKGTGWTNLIRDIKAASNDVSSEVVNRWRAYRQEVFTGEAPAVEKGRIAPTPSNNAAFKRYETLYHEFRVEFERMPPDLVAIDRVRSLAKDLTETAKGFDYEVSADVKRFLEAIHSGGATLDMLTDTVKQWLLKNGAFTSYRILSRGSDGSR